MKRWICLPLILCMCLFGACTTQAAPAERMLFAMDTEMSLRVYGADAASALDALSGCITQLDGALSVTDPDSALSALNRTGSSDDADLLALAQAAQALCAESGGAVDPTVYPAVQLWGFPDDAYRVPTQAELDEVCARIGMDNVHTEGGSLTLTPGTQLDFGALAKGYTADRCRALLEESGCSGVLSLGGNVQTVGRKPDGSPWVIGIADPLSPAQYCATLTLTGSHAVVTSGDYQRYFEQDGVRYCHIIDPATGRPAAAGLRSVTVVCDNGLRADGLATALFVLGLDRGAALWRAAGDFEAVFYTQDNEIYVTQGLAQAVSGCAFSVIEP